MMRFFLRFSASVVTLACFGVASAIAAPRVIESFNVGPSVVVRALAVEAKANRLWVGTTVGVNAVDLGTGKMLDSFTRREGLANEYVFAIGVDQEGYKWFGTNAGGASRYRDGNWKTYFPMHGLADYWIYAFANQADDTVWVGTWAGANSFNLKTKTFKTYKKELINEWVYGIDVDRKNRVWFGTEGGVSMFDGKKWTSWNHKQGIGAPNLGKLPPSTNTGLGTRQRHNLETSAEGKMTYNPAYVFCVQVAMDDTVWAGTWGGGVSRYDGKRWTHYTSKQGLAGNIVFSMLQDRQGVFWFGTNRGLSRFDGKKWRNFTPQDGLPTSNIYALAEAPNGDIWVGMQGGVARIGQ